MRDHYYTVVVGVDERSLLHCGRRGRFKVTMINYIFSLYEILFIKCRVKFKQNI